MANYTTGQDLIATALEAAGESSTGSSRLHPRAVELVDQAYKSLCLGGREWNLKRNPNWWWLKNEKPLTLDKDLTSYTATMTENSTAVTLSGSPASSLVGWHLKVLNNVDIYEIVTHEAATDTLVLDAVYTGDSGAEACTIFKVDYTLDSEVLRLLGPMTTFRGGYGRCSLQDEAQFRYEWPLNTLRTGTPTRYMMTGEQTVRFNRSGGDEYIQLRYGYLDNPETLVDTASSIPRVPVHYRKVLSDMAASWLCTDKDDARNQEYAALAMAGMKSMLAQNEREWKNQEKLPLVRPRQGYKRRHLQTSSGLYLR